MSKIEVEQNGKNTILQIEKENNISEIRILFKDYKVSDLHVKFYEYDSKGN